MTRKSRGDWLDAAAAVLADLGADGLTIEALTVRLGVTKGSFYHHFASYQGFKESLLSHIEQRATLRVIGEVDAGQDPGTRLARLLAITVGVPSGLEGAMRAWALRDTLVRGYQERIDSRRIEYVRTLLSGSGVAATRAPVLARLIYTVYVGSQQVMPPIQGADLLRLYEEVQRLLAGYTG